jgi:uncharacterized protein (TIGR03437 family)
MKRLAMVVLVSYSSFCSPAWGQHGMNGGTATSMAARGKSTAVSAASAKANTSTTLTSTPNPSYATQSVTFTATVSGQSGGSPTGTVTFSYGSTGLILGTAPLSGGSAVLTTAALPQSLESVTAVYSGDASFAGSTSNTVSQVVSTAVSAANEWTWMGGSSTMGQYGGVNGVYGAVLTPALVNMPGSRQDAANWTDNSGRFWLFGGTGFAANSGSPLLNDLWEFDPATNEWAWMGGSSASSIGNPGTYGTPLSPDAKNIPGSRAGAATWTDSLGRLWLFGGSGYDGKGSSGYLNDLWEFYPSKNQWAWMSGSSTVVNNSGQSGVYGALKTPAAGNVPGGREYATSWTDTSGNFWLFGGCGYDAKGTYGHLNDVWEYSPSTGNWAWMGGSSTVNGAESEGTLGVPSAGNIPGNRCGASSWTDSSGNFWVFGGYGHYIGAYYSGDEYLNDLWEFNPATDEWACVRANSGGGGAAALGTFAADNVPAGRQYASSWTDGNGNLWFFGGNAGGLGGLNDLWEFNPTINEWAWMGGADEAASQYGMNQPGLYGMPGIPAAGNVPGGRAHAAQWTDSSGNLWLFGGYGSDSRNNNYVSFLNDLWKYQPAPVSLPPAAAPVFSLAAGSYPTGQTVTISDATPGATIYYATNGVAQIPSWSVYTGPITVSATETLAAMATAPGYSTSAVASAAYLIASKAAAPIFSVPTGTYTTAQTVAISAATTGTAIYYTTNGTTPTTGSCVYSTPITVSATQTLKAIAASISYTLSYSASDVATATYTIAAAPGGVNEWIWMGGSSTIDYSAGVYGTLQKPAAGNMPGARSGAANWTDGSGNFWLFSGSGFNDLWEFSPTTNQWAWMGGSNKGGVSFLPGVYGTLGTPAAGNIPGTRENPVSWTDGSGNLWLFGGEGYDSKGTLGDLNDLWAFSTAANQWTWKGGSSALNANRYQPGVYGTLGVPAAGNVPGSRMGATGWTDSGGNLWLFGGNGYDANGKLGDLNDLWEFSPSTNQWAWIGGSSTVVCPLANLTCGQSGVYGTLGQYAPGNVPGGRMNATGWTDSSGNLWLYAGSGYDGNGSTGTLSDLWEFNPAADEWAWRGGSAWIGNNGGQFGIYGTLGTAGAANIPGTRYSATGWTDSGGNFWLFGGRGEVANGCCGSLSDLWEFNPSANQWTWMGGSSTAFNLPGVFSALGTPAPGNIPGGRYGGYGWTDRNGNLWLLGGGGIDASGKSGNLNDLWKYQLAQPATAPAIASGGIVPAGSSATTIQPGEWVSIYGARLASATTFWNGDFPTSLGGTSVTINGKAAYLSLVSPGQINLQAPSDTATGTVPVVVTTAGGNATATVTLAAVAPSFFLLDGKNVAGIVVSSDGSGGYNTIGPTGTSLGYPTVAAKAGDIVELFGTGFGPTNPMVPAGQPFSGAAPTTNAVTLLINGVSVTPTFAGLSGAGLYQINLTVPAGLGTGDMPLIATVGGAQTPAGVVISLQ